MFLQDIPEEERKALQIISYIGCGISSVCLIISIVFFLLQGWDILVKINDECVYKIFKSPY